jgi:hypothetical protein
MKMGSLGRVFSSVMAHEGNEKWATLSSLPSSSFLSDCDFPLFSLFFSFFKLYQSGSSISSFFKFFLKITEYSSYTHNARILIPMNIHTQTLPL